MYLKIQTQSELRGCIDSIKNSPISWLAFDTEFFREATYYPVLSLIQIASASQIWVIDALSCGDLTPLKPLLEDPNIKKIFHAGDQDWGILKQYTGAKTWPFMDTQVMAAFAKLGHGASLEKLVSELLLINLDKSQQRANWLNRPLTAEQLAYAAQDAEFVANIYPILEMKINDLGRMTWVEEEMAALVHKYDNANFDKDWLKLCAKGSSKWPIPFYAFELVKWREGWAKKLDLPRRHVLADAILEQVLQTKSMAHLKAGNCLPGVYADLKIFWQDLQNNAAVPTGSKMELEQMVNDHHQVFSRDQLELIKNLQSQVKAVASELEIPAFLVLNKQQMYQLIRQNKSSITGWRLQHLSKIGLGQSLKDPN